MEYASLPAVVDAAQAREPGAPEIWPEAPGNLSCTWAQGDADATEAAFRAAAHVVEIELVNNRLVVSTIEPRGALGVYDPASERYTLYINSQHVHGARAIVAGILGIEEDRLRILSYDLGGGFGMKYFTYHEQVLVAWAARKLGAAGALAVRPRRGFSQRHPGTRPSDPGGAGAGCRRAIPGPPRADASPISAPTSPIWAPSRPPCSTRACSRTPTARPRSMPRWRGCSPTPSSRMPTVAPGSRNRTTWSNAWSTRPRSNSASRPTRSAGAT